MERRVGFESLKLFIRYQIDFKIDAKGVTPIPAPTKSTVSNYIPHQFPLSPRDESSKRTLRKSSLALPNGPSTITRGKTRLIGGFACVPTTLGFSLSPPLGLASKSQPRAFERAGHAGIEIVFECSWLGWNVLSCGVVVVVQ